MPVFRAFLPEIRAKRRVPGAPESRIWAIDSNLLKTPSALGADGVLLCLDYIMQGARQRFNVRIFKIAVYRNALRLLGLRRMSS